MYLPTYEEMRQYILSQGNVTVNELIDHFNLQGDYWTSTTRERMRNIPELYKLFKGKKKLYILYDIHPEAVEHVRLFMAEPYVKTGINHLTWIISQDKLHKLAKDEMIIPIILSIQ